MRAPGLSSQGVACPALLVSRLITAARLYAPPARWNGGCENVKDRCERDNHLEWPTHGIIISASRR